MRLYDTEQNTQDQILDVRPDFKPSDDQSKFKPTKSFMDFHVLDNSITEYILRMDKPDVVVVERDLDMILSIFLVQKYKSISS